MTNNTAKQAAHETAMKAANEAFYGGDLSDQHGDMCRAYLAHLRPQIEAEAREAALREAAEAVRAEHLQDPSYDDPTDIAYDNAVTDCERAIATLIEKEPTNAG